MIDRFDTHDLRHECRVVFVNVFDELELGPRRAHDQHFLGALESLDDGVIEVIRVGRVVVLRGGFGMSMKMVLRRGELQSFSALAVDAKQFRFVLVNPNGYVVECHGPKRAIFMPALYGASGSPPSRDGMSGVCQVKNLALTARRLSHHAIAHTERGEDPLRSCGVFFHFDAKLPHVDAQVLELVPTARSPHLAKQSAVCDDAS
jgi:hypothetical protein